MVGVSRSSSTPVKRASATDITFRKHWSSAGQDLTSPASGGGFPPANLMLATLTSFLDDQSELTSMFQLGHMTPVEATAFLEAATSMSLALGKGIPLSTTHTITSAIVGAAASRRTSDVRWIVFKWIVLVWVITICALAAFIAARLVNSLF